MKHNAEAAMLSVMQIKDYEQLELESITTRLHSGFVNLPLYFYICLWNRETKRYSQICIINDRDISGWCIYSFVKDIVTILTKEQVKELFTLVAKLPMKRKQNESPLV